jgi:hypothetical protein
MRYRRAQKSPGLLQYLAHARAKALLGYVQRRRASVGRACARAPGPADPGYELASAVFSAHQQGSEPIFTILPPRLASSHMSPRTRVRLGTPIRRLLDKAYAWAAWSIGKRDTLTKKAWSRDGCLPVAAQRHIFQARTVSARKRLHRPPTFTRLTALSLSCGSSVPFQASTLFTYSPHSAERRLRARRCCSRRSPNPSSSNAEAALLVATLAADSCPALLGYTLYANMKVSEVAALFGADSAAVLAANALDFALDPYCL